MKERVTFNEAADAWLAAPSLKLGRNKGKCWDDKIKQFSKAWGDKDILDIDQEMVDDFFDDLKTKKSQRGKPYANATINIFVGAYRAIMNFARDELRCKIHPPKVRQVRGNARTEFLEQPELERLKKHLDPLRADLLTYSALTGARVSACTDLRFDQISEDGKWITYSDELTKNGTPWIIPIVGKIEELIHKRMKMRDELEAKCIYLKGKIEYVFFQNTRDVKRNGKKMNKTSVCNKTFHKALKKAGLGDREICFHVAGRHTFATNAKRKGVDDRLIMASGNWKSRASMDRYSHIVGPDLIEAQKQMQGLT